MGKKVSDARPNTGGHGGGSGSNAHGQRHLGSLKAYFAGNHDHNLELVQARTIHLAFEYLSKPDLRDFRMVGGMQELMISSKVR